MDSVNFNRNSDSGAEIVYGTHDDSTVVMSEKVICIYVLVIINRYRDGSIPIFHCYRIIIVLLPEYFFSFNVHIILSKYNYSGQF